MAPDGSPRGRARLGLVPLSAGEEALYARRDEAARRRRRLLAVRAQERQAAQLVTRRYRDNLARLRGRRAESDGLELRARHEQLVAALFDEYLRSLGAVGSAQRGARDKLRELLQQAGEEAKKWSFNDAVVAKQRSGEAAREREQEERHRLVSRLEAQQNLSRLRDLGSRQREQASEHARRAREAAEKSARAAEEQERARRKNAPLEVLATSRPHGKDVVSYRLTRLHCLSAPADLRKQPVVKVVRHNTQHPSAVNGIEEAAKFRDEADKRLEQARQMSVENLEKANARGASAINTVVSLKEGDKVMQWLVSIDELERKNVSPPIDTITGFHSEQAARTFGSGTMKEFEHLLQIDEEDSGAISVFSAGTEEDSADELFVPLASYSKDIEVVDDQMETRGRGKLGHESVRRGNAQAVIKESDGAKETSGPEVPTKLHKNESFPSGPEVPTELHKNESNPERHKVDSTDDERVQQTQHYDSNPASDDESAGEASIEKLEDLLQDVLNLRPRNYSPRSRSIGISSQLQHPQVSGAEDGSKVLFSGSEVDSAGGSSVSSCSNLDSPRVYRNFQDKLEPFEVLHRDPLQDNKSSPISAFDHPHDVDKSKLPQVGYLSAQLRGVKDEASVTSEIPRAQSLDGKVSTKEHADEHSVHDRDTRRESEEPQETTSNKFGTFGHGVRRPEPHYAQAEHMADTLNAPTPEVLSRSMLSQHDAGTDNEERPEDILQQHQVKRTGAGAQSVLLPSVRSESSYDAQSHDSPRQLLESSNSFATGGRYATQMSHSRRSSAGSSVAQYLPSQPDIHTSFDDSDSSHSSIGFAVQLALATGARRRKTKDTAYEPGKYAQRQEDARTRSPTDTRNLYDRRYSSDSSFSTDRNVPNVTRESELPIPDPTPVQVAGSLDMSKPPAPMQRTRLSESRSSSRSAESLGERRQHKQGTAASATLRNQPYLSEHSTRYPPSRSSWSGSESSSDAYIRLETLKMRAFPAPPHRDTNMNQPPAQVSIPVARKHSGGNNVDGPLRDSGNVSSSRSSNSSVGPPSRVTVPPLPASQSQHRDMSLPPAPMHIEFEERELAKSSSSAESSYEAKRRSDKSGRVPLVILSADGTRSRLSSEDSELVHAEESSRHDLPAPLTHLLNMSQPPAPAHTIYEQYSIVSDSTDAFGSHVDGSQEYESLSASRRSTLHQRLLDFEDEEKDKEAKEDDDGIGSSRESNVVLLANIETMQTNVPPALPADTVNAKQPPIPANNFFEQYSIVSDSSDAFGSHAEEEFNDSRSARSFNPQQQIEGEKKSENIDGVQRPNLDNDAMFAKLKTSGFPAPPAEGLDMSQPPAPVQTFFEQYSILSDSTDAFGSHVDEMSIGSQSSRNSILQSPPPDHESEEKKEDKANDEDADDGISRSSLSSSDSILMKFEAIRRRGLPAPPVQGFDMSQPPAQVNNFFEQYSIISDSTDAFGSHAEEDDDRLDSKKSDRSSSFQHQLQEFENEEKKTNEDEIDERRSSRSSSRQTHPKPESIFVDFEDKRTAGRGGSLAEAFQKRHPRFHLRAKQHMEQSERKRQAQLARQQEEEKVRNEEKANTKIPTRRASSGSSATDVALTEEKSQLLGRLASGSRAKVSEREMKERSRRLYQQLPEVVEQRRQEEVLRRRRERLNELREQEKARRLAQRERRQQRAKQ